MEWSGVPGNQKKTKKKNPLHLHLAGRCDLFWNNPLFKKKKKVQNRMHAKYASRQRIGGTVRCAETGEKTSFAHSARLFFSSHDGRIPFWRGV